MHSMFQLFNAPVSKVWVFLPQCGHLSFIISVMCPSDHEGHHDVIKPFKQKAFFMLKWQHANPRRCLFKPLAQCLRMFWYIWGFTMTWYEMRSSSAREEEVLIWSLRFHGLNVKWTGKALRFLTQKAEQRAKHRALWDTASLRSVTAFQLGLKLLKSHSCCVHCG